MTVEDIRWPSSWRSAPLWSMFDRVKDVGHPGEQMLSVYRDHGVVPKESRTDNFNKTAENRNIYQLVDTGWLIVNRMKAWQGSVGISSYRGIVSGHYICFRPKHCEDPRFLNYLLRSTVYAAELRQLSRGVRPNQIEIDNDWLRALSLRLPDGPTQRAIADYLDAETARIDSLIEKRRTLVDLMDERLMAYLEQLICAEDQLLPLRRFAMVQGGVTVDAGREVSRPVTRPYLRVANVQDGYLDLTEVTEIEVSEDAAARSTLRPGDVLMTEANGNSLNLGRGTVWTGEVPGCIHQNHVFAIRTDHSKFLPDLLALLTQSSRGRAYFQLVSSQVGIATISKSKVLDFPVPLISVEEQRRRVDVAQAQLQNIRAATAALDRQVSLLLEHRQALITAVVTGQVEVPGMAA